MARLTEPMIPPALPTHARKAGIADGMDSTIGAVMELTTPAKNSRATDGVLKVNAVTHINADVAIAHATINAFGCLRRAQIIGPRTQPSTPPYVMNEAKKFASCEETAPARTWGMNPKYAVFDARPNPVIMAMHHTVALEPATPRLRRVPHVNPA